MLAKLLAAFRRDDALPYLFAFVVEPAVLHPPREVMAAEPAFQHAAEGIHVDDPLPAWVCELVRPPSWACPLLPDGVGLIVDLGADDRLMVVLKIVFVRFTEVGEPSFGYRVDGVGLPHHDVAFVLLVLDDAYDCAQPPPEAAPLRPVAEFLQLPCDDGSANSFDVPLEDVPYGPGLLLVDLYTLGRGIVVIAQTSLKADEVSPLHLHLESLLDVLRGVVDLLLSHG